MEEETRTLGAGPGRLMGVDVKTTPRTWTVQQALESVPGFVAVLLLFSAAAALA